MYLRHMYAQPSGAATPRDSDAHERIAVPKAFCVLREHTRPRSQSVKLRCSDTCHAGFPKHVKQSEGSDSAPTQNTTCFGVCALVCDFSRRAECVPTFARESKHGPFVGEVENWDEKRLGIKFMAAVSPDFSLC